MKINDEGLRVLANIAQHYDAWIQAKRTIADGRLQWKTVAGRDYLYRIVDSHGNGRSLGVRSLETEQLYDTHVVARETVKRTWLSTIRDGALYRALRLPRIASYAAEVLRELDTNRMLGNEGVLVVGTTALAAYAIEAGTMFPSTLDATEDFDLTWIRSAPLDIHDETLFSILKKIDATYTINMERSFQARNADGQEIELLLPKSLEGKLSKHEQFSPIPLIEQDWLLLGQHVSHVVCGFDAKPARIVAPDPRWFALHKCWLSKKPERDPLKKDKDFEQGMMILDLVGSAMPRFQIDAQFRDDLPIELVPHFDHWATTRSKL